MIIGKRSLRERMRVFQYAIEMHKSKHMQMDIGRFNLKTIQDQRCFWMNKSWLKSIS